MCVSLSPYMSTTTTKLITATLLLQLEQYLVILLPLVSCCSISSVHLTVWVYFLCVPPGDESPRESSPFINSDNDREHYYEGKNMALFEVRQNDVSPNVHCL